MSQERVATIRMRSLVRRSLAAAGIAGWLWLAPGLPVASARATQTVAPNNVASAWTFDWGVIVALASIGGAYLVGVDRLWDRAGRGRGIRRWEAMCFAAGTLTLAVALISPLDALSEVLFSAHMTQHLLLIFVAPPLLVLGRPGAALAWAIPVQWVRAFRRSACHNFIRHLSRALSPPLAVWFMFALGFWIWHAPPLFEAAEHHAPVHAIEHLTFIAIGMQFWWLVIRRSGRRNFPDAAAIFFVFTTMLQQTLLGALLTFSNVGWYSAYGDTASGHLSQIADQQLAGLIMWMPSNALYLLVTGALLVRWLQREGAVEQPTFEPASR